jgi:hypothetical protein
MTADGIRTILKGNNVAFEEKTIQHGTQFSRWRDSVRLQYG